MAEILYFIRPEIGKYCWDSTIFRESEDLDVPEEMTGSRVEVEEERTQKVTYSGRGSYGIKKPFCQKFWRES